MGSPVTCLPRPRVMWPLWADQWSHHVRGFAPCSRMLPSHSVRNHLTSPFLFWRKKALFPRRCALAKNHSADREERKPTCNAAERESPTRGGARALLSWHNTGTRWCTGTAMHEWQHLDMGTEWAAPSTGHPASICSSPPLPFHNLQQVCALWLR